MIKFIDTILKFFEPCFSRKASFHWFVIIVCGFMVRSDHLGVTSVVRDLALRSNTYEPMLRFFRASSWSLSSLRSRWLEAILHFAPLYRENNRVVLIGDGVKQAKEGKFMPAVKKLFQESENSSKPEYIFGHMFGGLGILAGNCLKWFCIPLSIRLHDGLKATSQWEGCENEDLSHVVGMINDAYEAVKVLGNALLLLDRYYLSVPALLALMKKNISGTFILNILAKAKMNCVAYEQAPPKKPGRGRPAKKGATIHLRELFETQKHLFQETKMVLYGKEEQVRYYHRDLLWGKKLYHNLRFVLVEYGATQSILVSTDLTMDPLRMIQLYSYRFRIECMFRELKQQFGAFCYHFWSKSMPKLNRYQKKKAIDPLQTVTDERQRTRILKAARAIECHMMLSTIAMGIVQMLSLQFSDTLKVCQFRYLRTPSKNFVSEATLMCYLQKYFFHFLAQMPQISISHIIRQKQKEPDFQKNFWVS